MEDYDENSNAGSLVIGIIPKSLENRKYQTSFDKNESNLELLFG